MAGSSRSTKMASLKSSKSCKQDENPDENLCCSTSDEPELCWPISDERDSTQIEKDDSASMSDNDNTAPIRPSKQSQCPDPQVCVAVAFNQLLLNQYL